MTEPVTASIHQIFPRFVFHQIYNKPQIFNQHLYEVAKQDALRNRPDESNPKTIGEKPTHIAHLRHNFLVEVIDPIILDFVAMVERSVKDYLQTVYGYCHVGELELMSDTFWQSRARGENLGINSHTHLTSDLVCTYYPRVDLDYPQANPMRSGAVRFYDPMNLGTRVWPNNNPQVFVNGWFQVVPQVGSMIVFEGHIPHDSTFFDGDERLCIPVMVNVKTPRSHCKVPLSKIREIQKSE